MSWKKVVACCLVFSLEHDIRFEDMILQNKQCDTKKKTVHEFIEKRKSKENYNTDLWKSSKFPSKMNKYIKNRALNLKPRIAWEKKKIKKIV